MKEKVEVSLTGIYCEGKASIKTWMNDETTVAITPFMIPADKSTNIYSKEFVDRVIKSINENCVNCESATINVYADYSGAKIFLDTIKYCSSNGTIRFENGELPDYLKTEHELVVSMKKEIIEFMTKYGFNTDYAIYTYDDKWNAFVVNSNGAKETEEAPNFKYSSKVLSMRFENGLMNVLNGCVSSNSILNEFNTIFEKRGYYYELGNSWNLSVYSACKSA